MKSIKSHLMILLLPVRVVSWALVLVPWDMLCRLHVNGRIRRSLRKAMRLAIKGDYRKAFFHFRVAYKISRMYLTPYDLNFIMNGGDAFPLVFTREYFSPVAAISMNHDGQVALNPYALLTCMCVASTPLDHQYLLMETGFVNKRFYGWRGWLAWVCRRPNDPQRVRAAGFWVHLCRMYCYRKLGDEKWARYYQTIVEEMPSGMWGIPLGESGSILDVVHESMSRDRGARSG